MSKARLEAIPAFKKIPIKFGNYKLRYAWVSQRGFYPDEPNKANQDSHVEVENFCAAEGIEDMHLFGVFDGHGKTGDACAQWARDKVPGELAAALKVRPACMASMRRAGGLIACRACAEIPQRHRALLQGGLRQGECRLARQ